MYIITQLKNPLPNFGSWAICYLLYLKLLLRDANYNRNVKT